MKVHMSDIKVRVKKGRTPYGGRYLEVVRFHTYPNGRKVVITLPPESNRSRHHGLALGTRTLEYNIEEVEGAFVASERMVGAADE